MVLVGLVIVAGIFSYQYFHSVQVQYLSITSFQACVDAGYTVVPSYPEKCTMPGKFFINTLQNKATSSPLVASSTIVDYKNLTYLVDGQQVQLHNGEGTLTTINMLKQLSSTLKIVGEPFLYDINGDQKTDVVFFLDVSSNTTNPSAQYMSAAIQLHSGYSGANAVFIDRGVNSGAFVYKNGEIVLRYTTLATTTIKEKYFMFKDDILIAIHHK